MRVYLDTSVYDAAWLLEKREGKLVFPDFEKFVNSAIDCKHFIIASELIEKEMLSKYPQLEGPWADFIRQVGKKLIWAELTDELLVAANVISDEGLGFHHPDSVHFMIAKNFADALVTFDSDFGKAAARKMTVKNLNELD
ncbi:MAG: hypothetical protein AABX01_01680 [Candidatus Micrarchaeota archaeon]